MPISNVDGASVRWMHGDTRTNYSWPQCRFCGMAAEQDCRPVACLLCGTAQCLSNVQCGVCFHGYLPGWYRAPDRRICGYKNCGQDAVAAAPRVGQVCLADAGRAKVMENTGDGRGLVTLTEYVALRIAHRDSGAGWEHWKAVPMIDEGRA